MKKTLKVIFASALSITMLSFGGWIQTKASPTKFKPNLPNYQKLDPELAKEMKADGVKVQGKELKGYNGKAYLKPGQMDNLKYKDVTGKKKGIAILVDFKVENTEGKISDVAGVNYEQIPSGKFDDLLNGTEYNPYDLEVFKWLKEYKGQEAPTDRTLKNYYTEVSYGDFEIDVDLSEWVTLPQSYEYYLGQNKGYNNVNGDAHTGELIKDAIAAADKAGVDFSQYAVKAEEGDFGVLDIKGDTLEQDGNVYDKIVSNIFIIHRGTGAEYSSDPSIIWSHQWDILSASYFGEYYQTGLAPDESKLKFTIVDGVVVNDYNIVPEVGQNITGYGIAEPRKPSPAYPGVYAHEFGHQLGLPDQYDYGYDSEGTGMFTLMASGSYGNSMYGIGKDDVDKGHRWYSGNTPVHMDAWSKYYLGFAQPKEIKPEDGKQRLTISPSFEKDDIYKVVVPGSNGREYFLIENRQQKGYDEGLIYTADTEDLHGLVVYHVDDNVFSRNFSRPNEAANWDINNRGKNFTDKETGENHYAISVVQADGKYDLEKGYNDGDAGDVFPGKYGVTELKADVKSSPNTISYYKWGNDSRSTTGLNIESIIENEDGSVTFDIFFQK